MLHQKNLTFKSSEESQRKIFFCSNNKTFDLKTYALTLNIRMNLLSKYVNFVDRSLCEHARYENTTKENNTFFKVLRVFLLLIYLCFYLNT